MLKTLFSRLAARVKRSKRTRVKPALAEDLAAKAADPIEASLQALGRSRTAQVAPVLLLATGAGAAFWWWTQWARGAEESKAAVEGKPEEPQG